MAVHVDRPDFLASDLDDRRADGRRWELIDGVVHVTPSPTGSHQLAVFNIGLALRSIRPDGLAVVLAPFDFRPSEATNLQPDVMVVAASAATAARAIAAPALVVEVLSPGTRTDDLGSKRIAYHDHRVPAYWVVDPAARTLTVFTGDYETPATHGPGGLVELTDPFPVTIDLDHLLDT